MKSQRAYTMRARARAMEETKRRILNTAVELLKSRARTEVRLEDVARKADVSVPTVLRAYGSRAELLDRAFDEIVREIRAGIHSAEPGDIAAAVTAWFDHYEQHGDLVIHHLAQEADPNVGPMVQIGRTQHRKNVRRQLGPQLARFTAKERGRRLDALVCASDVYTWKLLRRDMARPRAQAEQTMRLMIEALLGDE